MVKASVAHLRAVNETYLQHFGVAFRYCVCCFGAAFAALVHGVVPGIFQTTASDIVKDLAKIRKAPVDD
ncbi:MAG: DUF6356 family protein [Pseudomonadota bacterium]